MVPFDVVEGIIKILVLFTKLFVMIIVSNKSFYRNAKTYWYSNAALEASSGLLGLKRLSAVILAAS